jgi:hypothetical protein
MPMGIEGEQLVFDYLSRVGDLAHGTSMSAAERAALVNRLRTEIGQRRAEAGGAESRGEVTRILGGIGRPEDVVAAAAEDGAAPAPAPAAAAPAPATPAARAKAAGSPEVPVESAAPVPPPRPSAEGGGPAGAESTWPDGQIGRFVGGLLPEAFRRDEPGGAGDGEENNADGAGTEDLGEDEYEAAAADAAAQAQKPTAAAKPARTPRLLSLVRGALSGRRAGGAFEMLAVALLAAGAVAGSVYPMIFGWLLAYWSPRLGRAEAQWATFGMPALVATAYGAWLAGRANGTWGEPLPEGAAGDALGDHWPMLLRAAALASAAFLLWRARRSRPA